MNTYAVSVIVEGFDMDSEYQNAGLECLSYDAIVSSTAGLTIVDADVDAASEVDAILQLISDLRSLNVTVVRLDAMLVSVSEVADRTGVSRETARLWATGQRRDGFPAPFTVVGSSLYWAWSDVVEWATSEGIACEGATPVSYVVVESFNGAFAQVRASQSREGWLEPKMPAPLAHLQQRIGRSKPIHGWQSIEPRSA